MDAQGIVPEQLDQACRLHRPKAVYLVPTIHNPTAATMPPARRQRVAEIIRRHGLMLFEDDAYGPLDRTAVPLASLIPERTYLALSLSKCMAPGLRASFVVAPDRRGAAVLTGALRATVQIPVPLTVALVIRWLRDGSADAIVRAIRAEAGARQRLAAKVLHGYAFSAHPCGHHVWLPLPEGWGRAEFVADGQRQGLAVVASDAFAVTEAPPHALRVSLGAARDRSELSRALELLRGSLASPAPTTMIV
jgi:DNA-binding transcriptional MocR family regulator